jgi:Copper transport outer membrane protein, MctB
MFDLRYHVASLAAVFFALVIGILVGVALASHGLGNTERKRLERDLRIAQSDNTKLQQQVNQNNAQNEAFADFTDKAYSAVMQDRLQGMRIAVLFIGRVDRTTRSAVNKSVADAGGTVLRMRAVSVPVNARAIQTTLRAKTLLASFATGKNQFERIGTELAAEFLAGGETPVWDALEEKLVEERSGSSQRPVDGVVVARSVPPQTKRATAKLLTGLLSEFADASVPVVGVEPDGTQPSAVPTFSRFGLSTVDDVDLKVGHVALAVLLSSPDTGSGRYGLRAGDTFLPDIPPVSPATTTSGG